MLKKILALFIVLCLLLSCMSVPVMAAGPQQFPGLKDIGTHWAADTIKKWSSQGLIGGYPDGYFRPNALMTRAEFCATVNNVFGFSKKSPENYKDVPSTKWYAGTAAIAKGEGYTSGWGEGDFDGDKPVTRAEAALALVTAFKYAPAEENEKFLSGFTDLGSYDGAAREAIAVLAANEILSGYPDKTFRPQAGLKRGECVKIFEKIIGEWINSPGIYSGKVINGNTVVKTANVTLKDFEIKNNLYLAEGVGEGSISLNNVKVTGKTFINGGGANSVTVENSTLGDVIVEKNGGNVRVVNTGSIFGNLILRSGVNYEGRSTDAAAPVNIIIDKNTPPGQIIELSGTIESLSVNAPGVIIKVKPGASVGNLTIDSLAEGVELNVDGKVLKAVVNAKNVKINGTVLKDPITTAIDSTTYRYTGGGSTGSSGNSGDTLPQAPAGLAVSLAAYNSAAISWIPVSGATGYNIYRSETIDGAYSKINQTAATDSGYKDINLSADTGYYYRVSAVNSGGESAKTQPGYVKTPAQPEAGEWKLMWNEDFNGTPGLGVDTDKWSYEVSGDGFGNGELQYSTDRTDNVFIEQDPLDSNNRLLTIKAIKEEYNGKEYTSGRIKTAGKFDFTYGRVEMKAKLPYGKKGIGCSLWMLGSNYDEAGWPAAGEIDIMEWVGKPDSRIYGTLHGPGYSAGESIGSWHENSEGFSDDYHTYAVEWEPNEIRWYFDGILYAWRTPEDLAGKEWVFDHDFNIILGLGVGGTWPGAPDESTAFPQEYKIDYIKVFQREGGIYPENSQRDLAQIKSVGTGKFVCADKGNNDALSADRDSTGAWETFEIKELGQNKIALLSLAGCKYVSAGQDGSLAANKETIGAAETFEMIDNPDGTKLLKCFGTEKYVTVSGSLLTATAVSSPGNGEKFVIYRALKPSVIKMTSGSADSISMRWAAVNGATGYDIYRAESNNDGNYVKVNTLPVTGTGYTDTGLTAAKAYYYKVAAKNEKGESPLSDMLFATTAGYGKAGTKNYSYIIAASNSRIIQADSRDTMVPLKASANEVSSDAQLFEIIYNAEGNVGFASKALNTLVCADSWNVTDFQLLPRSGYSSNPGGWEMFTLLPQGDGTFAIKANNGGKYVTVDPITGILRATAPSVGINEKFILVTPEIPGRPIELTVANYLDTSVDLSWKAPAASDVAGYNIYRATSIDGEYTKRNTSLVTATVFSDTGVNPATEYFYRVSSVNIRGEADSDAVNVTTRNGPLPSVPSGMKIEGGADNSVALNWAQAQDAEGYNVYRALSRFGNYEKIAATSDLNYTAAGSGYYYRVSAENENGETVLSEPVSLEMELFGPNVYIFAPGDNADDIQKVCNSIFDQQQPADTAQFGNGRYAFLFKPGTYTTNVKVGYYTQVSGLGKLPDDTAIGGLASIAALPDDNCTCNFWRSAENLTVNSNTPWAVSQAVSLRRAKINGSLSLFQAGGWASGGFLADSYITGDTNAGGQQQWFSRNTDWNNWTGGVWNMVFVGIAEGKAPAGDWTGSSKYTTVDKTPVIKEKPFLYIENGQYKVFVPALRENVKGTSWSAGDMGPGTSISIDEFYIAHPETDTAATINAALEDGKNLIFTPGQYRLTAPVEVNRANTVVLGLGLATLIADDGNICMKTADVDGISISGLLFDAGVKTSPVLLEIGPENSSEDHSANPTVLSDLYFRVGGREDHTGRADVCIIVNSDHVIGDNFWVWRADHGKDVAWDSNTSKNGIVVNGDNVTMYALMSEHFHQYCTLWNGNGGRTYFYQSEIAYDVPGSDEWMDGDKIGYASYKVADHVTSHEAWGLGIYSYHRDAAVNLHTAVEVPDHESVKVHNACTVMLAGNPGIEHVVNNIGAAVTKAGQRQEVIEYCNNGNIVKTPVILPGAGTYPDSVQVILACDTPGTSLLYTTDGSEPSEQSETSSLYTGPIPVEDYVALKVKAFKEGLIPSETVSSVIWVDKTGLSHNLAKNGAFNSDAEQWITAANDGADSVFTAEEGRLKMSASSDGPNTWSTMLQQAGIPLKAGKTYVLSFDMEADASRDISLCVESGANNSVKYLDTRQISAVKGNKTTYSYEFVPSAADSNGRLVFLLGGSGLGTQNIFFDNFYLWEKDLAAYNQVKTPYISLASGTYKTPRTVTLQCMTPDAAIIYTTDGSQPSASNGTVYTGAFTVSESQTLKAVAIKEGLIDSFMASESYSFTDNLALGMQSEASSGQSSSAFDGEIGTRWESDQSDPQWILVDLGEIFSVSEVKLVWETAAAKEYTIEVSADKESWTPVGSVTDGINGETREISFAPVSARYVKMSGTARTTPWGYSIYEFEVYAGAE